MVWVECPVLDVMQECAESDRTHSYGGLQLSKVDVPQTKAHFTLQHRIIELKPTF